MNRLNSLAISHKNGGGNFDASELASGGYAAKKGRLASFFGVVLAALLVFSAPCLLSSCSNAEDEEEDSPTTADYQGLLTAHHWEVTTASERLGAFWLDAMEADAYYCQLSADSIYFSEGETVNLFDDEGNVKSEFQITPCGKYPYAVKGNEIKINNQTFNINNAEADTFVLENEGWRLVLKSK